MDASAFNDVAEKALDDLFTAIDASVGDHVEVDFDNGILTIELPDGGQYVINKNAASQELWVSSPLSGAAHYVYCGETGGWNSTRGGGALVTGLAAELGQATGQQVLILI